MGKRELNILELCRQKLIQILICKLNHTFKRMFKVDYYNDS